MSYKYVYQCPHCDFILTKNEKITFNIKNISGVEAILKLSSIPGKYGYESNIDPPIKHGENIDFFCVKCSNNLSSKEYFNFIEIHLKITDYGVFKVLFSSIYGEKITYVILQDKMVKYRDDFFSLIERRIRKRS